MLRAVPVVAADNAPRAAIMVEVAAAPEAVQTEKEGITPDQISAEASVPVREQKQEETPQEQVVEDETKPIETKPDDVKPVVTTPVEEEKVEDRTVVLEQAEVQLPPERPKPQKRPAEKPKTEKRTEKKPRPRPQQAAASSKAAQEAQVEARQSDRMAAAQTASGASSMSPATWQSLLMAHLERRKPSNARERFRGTAYVRFTIDVAGNVLSVMLVRSSGLPEFDQESVALVHRASPVPAPPPGANRTITVPVRFNAD